MSIDNNLCIGCNACVMACQAENNIPIVGKDQIQRGRDMLWLRIDTYYRGDYSNPASFFEPVPCMHCELAPCEPVCPVAATVHSKEGLNMRSTTAAWAPSTAPTTARTRYAVSTSTSMSRANRTGQDDDQLRPAYPEALGEPRRHHSRPRHYGEVYLTASQRINAARIEAKKDEREIRDGEILTSCQQSCPTNAIVFGNIADPNSAVARLKAEPHDYSLLAET